MPTCRAVVGSGAATPGITPRPAAPPGHLADTRIEREEGGHRPPSLVRVAPGEAPAATTPKAGASFNEGDVLTPKVAGVKILAAPTATARALATLAKGAELLFLGEEKGGFIKVQGPDGEGWVRKISVGKQ